MDTGPTLSWKQSGKLPEEQKVICRGGQNEEGDWKQGMVFLEEGIAYAKARRSDWFMEGLK